jgi:hypothetical protein
MGMRMSPIWQKITRWLCVSLLIMASGGSTFVLSSCDPAVSSMVLTGFNDLSNTFVNAFFTLLQNQATQDQGTGTTTGTST